MFSYQRYLIFHFIKNLMLNRNLGLYISENHRNTLTFVFTIPAKDK